jgi:hypothetical protein
MGAAKGPAGQDGTRQSKGKKNKTIVRPATMPSSATDPAYPASITAAPSVTSLATAVGVGTDGKVQWDSLLPSKGNPKSGIEFVKVSLEFALKQTAWTQEQPSVDLKAAIEKCLNVYCSLVSIFTSC